MTWRASTVSLVVVCVSPISGFCYYTVYYMLTRFEVTFLGILVESEHGDEGSTNREHKQRRVERRK